MVLTDERGIRNVSVVFLPIDCLPTSENVKARPNIRESIVNHLRVGRQVLNVSSSRLISVALTKILILSQKRRVVTFVSLSLAEVS